MFVWKVSFAIGGVSTTVSNSYNVTSTTLRGAVKKAKRLDDDFNKELVDLGDDPEASVPIKVEIICGLDDD